MRKLLLLVLIFLSVATLWSYFYFSLGARESVLELTAGSEKKGILIYDERSVDQELTLPERVDQLILPFQLDGEAGEGSLVLSMRKADKNEPFWSQSIKLTDTTFNEAYFYFLPNELSPQQKYIVRVGTQGVDTHAGLRLPYEYENDSSYPEGVLRIYGHKEGVWEKTNERSGNIALQFLSEPPIGTRFRLATEKVALPVFVVILLGLGILRAVRNSEQKRVKFPSWKEILLVAVIGLALSIIATLPLYQSLSKISTHGDIQRGLIFSGVARQALLSGELPFWNPYICGGVPLLADLESWFLQPFFLLTLPFNEVSALKITYTLTFLTFFVGWVLLARILLKYRLLPSIVFGVLLSFSGYLSQHLSEGYFVWIGAAWIPWFLLFGILSFKNIKYIPLAGLMLAFMFGGGTMHMAVYSLLYLVLFTLFNVNFKQLPQRIAIVATICIFFVSLSAIKLIPAMTLLQASESRPGFVPPITLLPKMLLERGLVDPLLYEGIVYRWTEFGNYVGYIGLTLAVIGFFLIVRNRSRLRPTLRSFLLASLVMLAIAFISLPVTHGPLSSIVDLFRMPSRTMIFSLIGLASLAGYALQKLGTKKYVPIALLITALLTIDLVSNDYLLFQPSFTLAMPTISPQERFTRVVDGYTTPDDKYYKAAYVDFRENRGTNGMCRFYQPVSNTTGADSSNPLEPYSGEVYLTEASKGVASLRSVSTNEIIFDSTLKEPAKVIVNQNYYPGWQISGGKEVENIDGLIAVPLLEGTHTTTLRYTPQTVIWNGFVSVLALVFAGLWFIFPPYFYLRRESGIKN